MHYAQLTHKAQSYMKLKVLLHVMINIVLKIKEEE